LRRSSTASASLSSRWKIMSMWLSSIVIARLRAPEPYHIRTARSGPWP
jgi:hypothetical protein